MIKTLRDQAIVTITVLGLGVLILWTLVGIPSADFPRITFYLHRRRYQAIVERVRHQSFPPDQVIELYLDDMSNPESLHPLTRPDDDDSRGLHHTGYVWATRTPSNGLTVVIETNDAGHLGEYGYAYSDVTLHPHPMSASASDAVWYLDVPGELNWARTNGQIDRHWWAVFKDQ